MNKLFTTYTRDQLRNLPAMQPLIGRTLDRGTLNVISAAPASAKSFLVLDWCACLATKKPWQGRTAHFPDPNNLDDERSWDAAEDAFGILYVCGEGTYGLNQRLEAWEAAWGHEIPSDRLTVMPEAVNLLDPNHVLMLASYVHENHIGLIVFDTLARCMPGGDENSAQDMGRAVQAVDTIRRAMEGTGTAIVVHHTNKNGSMRGSSALEGAADCIYSIERIGDSIELECTKRKDGAEYGTVHLKLREANGSCVLESNTANGTPDNPLIKVFEDCFSEQGSATKTELKSASGLSDAHFYRALNSALRAGHMTATNGNSPRYSLARTNSHNLETLPNS